MNKISIDLLNKIVKSYNYIDLTNGKKNYRILGAELLKFLRSQNYLFPVVLKRNTEGNYVSATNETVRYILSKIPEKELEFLGINNSKNNFRVIAA
ncbi:MAG: hypothetical protein U9Q66_00950 [Patescibacteria group bacterium]|nr:hypothetical protein [Patescibacteria group bacterium]